MTEIIQQIEAVIRTLDSVDVKGLNNFDKLLGCAQALQNIISELDKRNKQEEGGVDGG